MTESAPVPEPPVTGVPEIDAALAAVRLDGPVAEHHAELSAAVEVLQQALRSPRS
ncbi:hypothetical protein [Propionicimonas sp.]|uniref:hypothetical protein n=1 Tax=Propionicimonas sp. TaxID=1955623 RepID=UPI0039E3C5EF